MSQNPALPEGGRGGSCTLAGRGSRQCWLCCVISFQCKGSKFHAGESGQQNEVTGLSFGPKEAGKALAAGGGVCFWLPYRELVPNQDPEWGVPQTHRCVRRRQTTAAEVCRAQFQRAVRRSFSSLSLPFSLPRVGQSAGSHRCLSFSSFPRSSSTKTCSQAPSLPWKPLIPTLPTLLFNFIYFFENLGTSQL